MATRIKPRQLTELEKALISAINKLLPLASCEAANLADNDNVDGSEKAWNKIEGVKLMIKDIKKGARFEIA